MAPLQIGNSLFDEPGSEKVASLIAQAQQRNIKVVFPVDYVTADKFAKDAQVGAPPNPSLGTSDSNRSSTLDRDRDGRRRYPRWLDGFRCWTEEPRTLPDYSFGSKDHSLERVGSHANFERASS